MIGMTQDIDYDDEISDDDYGFILDSDGSLKTFFTPDNVTIDDIPEAVLSLLEMFGYSPEDLAAELSDTSKLH